MCLTALCDGEVEEYHPSQPRHGGRRSMTYILIVAGTAFAFYAAAMFIDRAREEHRDMTRTELLGSTEPRAPGLRPGFSFRRSAT